MGLVARMKSVYENITTRIELRKRGLRYHSTLQEIWSENLRRNPEVPHGLILEDPEGNRFKTGLVEHGPNDFSGIILYPVKDPNNTVQYLYNSKELSLLRLVGY